MFQTKYKYFNKDIKMLLLLFFVLMWSLNGQQNPYGKSTTCDKGIVAAMASACSEQRFAYDGTTIQENTAQIARRNDAKKSASSISSTITSDNKDTNNKAASTTIYGNFNENDNNSHKLPHNVAKGEQQQPNMMYMNMIRPKRLQSTSLLISAMSVEATPAVALLPPTESLLMPKDQLNKTQYSANENNENKPEEEAKLNETTEQKTVHNSISNRHNKRNIRNISKKNTINETNAANLYEISNENKIDMTEDKNKRNNMETNESNKENLTTFHSIAHAQQELILQFALKFKQISRVTYFTCKETLKANDWQQDKSYRRHISINRETVEFLTRVFASNAPGVMMKVVSIDHLINKDRRGMNNTVTRGRFAKFATRNTFTNIDWLEQVLRPEPLRQIVVLNLSCGLSSRRLLELASNKAFFNSMYHWLLLEDYVFNRQNVIDDADDVESKMNSYSNSNSNNKSTQIAAKSFREEIVNDSTARNGQVKQLSSYLKDVVGVCTSGLESDKQHNVTAANSGSTSSSTFKIVADYGPRQRILDDKPSSASSNANRAGITDADDIEIIENFLEKLNININTEVVLAKRCTRVFLPTTNSSTSFSTHSLFNMMPAPALARHSLTNSTPMDLNDYKTLQKMDYYLLYDVWNPGLQYGGVLNVTKIGNFTRSAGLYLDKWYRTTSTTRRRLNMQLARIRCLVVIIHKNRSDTLEEYLTSHYDTHLDSMNRFNFALLTHVRDLFNFSFILSKTPTWGYLKNGKFDGMIGALVRKQADIGGSPIFFRIERAKVIDYTTRTWVARPCFIFRHPRSTKKDRIVFLQPFSDEIWIFLFGCGCLTIVFLWLLTTLEHKFYPKSFDLRNGINCPTNDGEAVQRHTSVDFEHNMEKEKAKVKAGVFQSWLMCCRCLQNRKNDKCRPRCGLFIESLLFYVGSICQQGLPFRTFFISGRCIVITSLMFSFAIYQFYSASIVGTLLMEKSKTIRTLRDLIHSSLDIGIEDIVYNKDYFLHTKDPDALELYAKKVSSVSMSGDSSFGAATPDGLSLPTQMTELTDAAKAKAYRNVLHSHETGAHANPNKPSNWYDPEYGVAKVKKGRFAFHVDVATAYKIIADSFTEKEICDLAEIQLFPPQKMVNIVQKGSPLRKVITYGLRRVTEVGLADYQRKVWHSPKPRCIKQLHTDDLRVDIQTFTSALLVLIFGYAVSLLILSLEIVHYKLQQQYITLRIQITRTSS